MANSPASCFGANPNELFVLLNGWHLDSIRIGMISFFETPSILAHGVQIGVVECDPLIIHSNGEMCVHEFGFQDNILWSVAKSPSHVLEPLSLAAKFLGDRVFEEIESDDFVAAKVLATRCTALAGGDEHLDFFKMLLGAER